MQELVFSLCSGYEGL